MKLLETYVEISARDEALRLGLKNARGYARREVGEMQKMMNSLAFPKLSMSGLLAGVATIYSVKYAIDKLIGTTVTLGDTYDKMSKRTGIAVETLSELGYVATLTGGNIEVYEKSLRYLANTMLDMQRGLGLSKDTFKEMGISVTDTSGKLKSTVDIMMEAADVIARMTDETKQVAFASDLFGARSGTQLLPALKMGSAAIREMMAEAKRLGITMKTEDATAAAVFKDQLETLMGALEGIKRSIAVGLLPMFTEMARKVTEWAVANRELIRNQVKEWLDRIGNAMTFLYRHKDTIVNVFKIAAIVIITEKLLILAAVITKVTEALVALGMAKGWQATMKILSGSAIVTALSTLATPAGLAVLGTLAAGGAIAVGIGEIRDHLVYIDSLKFAGTHTMVTDMKEYASLEEALAAAKSKRLTAEEMEKMGGMALTLGGFRKAEEIPLPVKVIPKIEGKIELPKFPEMKKLLPIVPVSYEKEKPLFAGTFGISAKEKPLDMSIWSDYAGKVIQFVKPAIGMYTEAWRTAGEERTANHLQVLTDMSDYERAAVESDIKTGLTGFERDKTLENMRWEWEKAALAKKYDGYEEVNSIIAAAERVHANNMIEIDRNATQEMISNAVEFGDFWGNMLVSVVEQSGNSFNNIRNMFVQMLKKMAISAAASGLMAGLFTLFTGGTGGFAAGLWGSVKKSLGIPGLQGGGEVSSGKPYLVGERGPELFMPKISGEIIPKTMNERKPELFMPKSIKDVPNINPIYLKSIEKREIINNESKQVVNDHSRWELHFHDNAGERAKMVGLDDAEFSRQFKRCMRDGKIQVKRTA